MEPIITKELHEVLELNPGKTHVHFTGDGHYHFRTFSSDDKSDKNLYTRLQEVAEKRNGIATGKHIKVRIDNSISGKPDERFKVAKTMTREEVLAIKPVDSSMLSVAGPTRAEILATLEVSDEELQAALKAIKAKKK